MHDLANLRSLLAVAEAGAITEAAHRLGLTQPALTRRIQQLEAEFGTALLQRGRNGATLTEAGQLVAAEARTLIERFEATKREVARHTMATGGTIRLGGGATAVSFLLPGEIAAFQSAYPNVHFQVKEGSSSDIAEDVAAGRLELGLVTLPIRKTGLDIAPLRDDQIVLIAAAGHPLTTLDRVPLAAIDGENFVGFEGGSAIRQIVDDNLRRAGVEINVVMELRSIPAILRMVATTKSLAFVSRLGVVGQDLVQEVPVAGLRISRKLALAQRKGGTLSPAAQNFRRQLLG
ncbi:MAG: LysR family transcriptional regulator [Pseudomonadales bacterium]|jgi:DNA-binding transcriptional LysR family regulator|nr:LysR family transcriptional regulator [Pseudomonadales bacterium]